jgi:hypothetical protein
MEYEKVICHVQTDMSLTNCDYKRIDHGIRKGICHVQTDISLTHCNYKTIEYGI